MVWTQEKSSGIIGSLSEKVVCGRCTGAIKITDTQEIDFLKWFGGSLIVVDKFCYLGDQINSGERCVKIVIARMRKKRMQKIQSFYLCWQIKISLTKRKEDCVMHVCKKQFYMVVRHEP